MACLANPKTATENRQSREDLSSRLERRAEGRREVARRVRELYPDINPGLVYFIGRSDGPIKIGFSKNPEHRIRDLQAISPYELTILATKPGAPADERMLHRRFAEHRLHGEWFHPHPDILAEIERLQQ